MHASIRCDTALHVRISFYPYPTTQFFLEHAALAAILSVMMLRGAPTPTLLPENAHTW
jgi:hypothetical protein